MTGRPERPPRGVVALTAGVHRLLRRLYPRRVRERFDRAMGADAARLVREEWERAGARGVAGAWLRLARDLLRSVPAAWREEWRRRGASRNGGGAMGAMGWIEDARWALRGLRRAPGFTLASVLVLGVGIAGVVTTLGVVDAYLLRGLPYPHAERLVRVQPGNAVPFADADPAVVEEAITWDLDVFTLVGGDRPELVRSAWVSPGYVASFDVRPALGRTFLPEDYGEGAAPVALLSHGLWQRRYGGDPDIVGRPVALYASDRPDDAEVFTVVGVLPADFWFHNAYTEMLAPLRNPNPLYMARLRAGVGLEEARRALEGAALRAGFELPAEGLRLVRFEDAYTERVRGTLGVLTMAAGLVLLLAGANAAILFLVRASGREGDFAVRRAMGARRGRLVRQLVAEGMLLAGGAALLGSILAGAALAVLGGPLQERLGVGIPGGAEALGLTGPILAAMGALTVLGGGALGLAGVAGIGHGAVAGGLGDAGRSGSVGRRRRRTQELLVGAELALSLALLVGAGLALRSAHYLTELDLGFTTRDRVTAQVNLRAAAYPDAASRAAFYDALAERARGIPGVEAVGMTVRVPFAWNFNAGPVEAEGVPAAVTAADAPHAAGLAAGPGLLDVLEVPIVRGRGLEATDDGRATPVVVVGRSLAERLWPGRDPVGLRLRERREAGETEQGGGPPWRTVVGVAEDILQRLDGEDPAEYWIPYAQLAPTSMTLVMAVREGAASPIGPLEEIVHALDPEVAVTSVLDLDVAVAGARAPSRFLAGILGGFSLFALVLAVLGLYGVVSYAAARQRRDVAVRMALGAESGRVVAYFLGERLPAMAAGMGAGLAGAALMARGIEGQLRGVSPWDPLTWSTVAGALLVSALVAAWWPARRAAAADPAGVLREG